MASTTNPFGSLLGGLGQSQWKDYYQSPQDYQAMQQQVLPQWKVVSSGEKFSIKQVYSCFFHRINEKVGYREGDAIKDPVDRLRIRVARWLNNE